MQNRTDADPYENLANAIISLAAKDYIAAVKKTKRKNASKAAIQDVVDLERFFHSSWYANLTSVDPDYLIRRLKEEVVR